MTNYKTLPPALCIDCSGLDFGPFNVLVVSDAVTEPGVQPLRHFYLRHDSYGVVIDMFSCVVADDQEAAEIAYSNAADHIPEFIAACMDWSED